MEGLGVGPEFSHLTVSKISLTQTSGPGPHTCGINDNENKRPSFTVREVASKSCPIRRECVQGWSLLPVC